MVSNEVERNGTLHRISVADMGLGGCDGSTLTDANLVQPELRVSGSEFSEMDPTRLGGAQLGRRET